MDGLHKLVDTSSRWIKNASSSKSLKTSDLAIFRLSFFPSIRQGLERLKRLIKSERTAAAQGIDLSMIHFSCSLVGSLQVTELSSAGAFIYGTLSPAVNTSLADGARAEGCKHSPSYSMASCGTHHRSL